MCSPIDIGGNAMVSKKLRITNALGIHLRPAGKISERALHYNCSVTFKNGDYVGNVKSVLGLLAGSVKCNHEIELICDGPDEEQALQELSALIEQELSSKD